MLKEEGVRVNYTPPVEQRGAGELVGTVVVSLACSGAYDLIKVGVGRFRDSRFGRAAKVELPEEPPETDGGNETDDLLTRPRVQAAIRAGHACGGLRGAR